MPISEVKIGGSFLVLADDQGRLLQTEGSKRPVYIDGIGDKTALLGGISVGHNFAFVIGSFNSEYSQIAST
jgi:hypothetical protein